MLNRMGHFFSCWLSSTTELTGPQHLLEAKITDLEKEIVTLKENH
jgi:hypothetical protein